jgi:probable phosphoglycerate mutase
MKTMELVLLRHAQPQWVDDQRQGVADPGLTDEGWKRARALSHVLSEEDFDSILVSPYRRCQETSQAVFSSSAQGCLDTQEWLREIRLPDFSQQPAEQVYSFFAEAKKRPLSSWWDGMKDGESFRHFHKRISSGLVEFLKNLGVERLRPDCKDDRHLFSIDPGAYGRKHLIVSHLGTTGLILSELLHLELVPWIWESFALDWNGIVRLETAKVADGYIFSLRKFNEYGHRDPTLGSARAPEVAK